MTRVGVVGAVGRTGSVVCRAIDESPDLDLVARLGSADPLEGLVESGADVAVDFTTPAAVATNVGFALEHGIHAVVGTTGWTSADVERFRALAERNGVNAVLAPNFALGAVLMMHLSTLAARHLPRVEIVEYHHEHKVDAPSGTALRTAELIAAARSPGPDDAPGEGPDDQGSGARGLAHRGVRLHAVRLPGVVASQAVLFGDSGQTLTIRHDTIDRTAFTPGVLLAIREVARRPGVTVGLEPLLGLEVTAQEGT